jgi:hypothetical protein
LRKRLFALDWGMDLEDDDDEGNPWRIGWHHPLSRSKATVATMSFMLMLKVRRIYRNYAVSITQNPSTPLCAIY